MHDLLRSLALQATMIVDDVALIHDLAFSAPGPSDEPKVTVSRIDAAAPMGDAQARELWGALDTLTTSTLVRLAYVSDLHRLKPEPLAMGDSPAVMAERLRAIVRSLEALCDCGALRADQAVREHVIGRRMQPPCIAESIELLALMHADLLPRPSAEELASMQSPPCVNCNERPQMQGRKRCTTCHTYFSKHKRERPSDLPRSA